MSGEEVKTLDEVGNDNVKLPAIRAREFWIGVTILALNCWVALSVLFMILKSWAASNWSWVAILCGMLCFSASLSLCAWKAIALDQHDRDQGDDGDQTREEERESGREADETDKSVDENEDGREDGDDDGAV
jgi:type VI protein secretion system component VasK